MAFWIMHLDGLMEQPVDTSGFPALLDELDHADAEQPNVSVRHESEWTVSRYADGRVVWENVEMDGTEQHLNGLSLDETLELMALVASGEIGVVAAWPWKPGYRP